MAIQKLNEAQLRAVTAPINPTLVLAGAGSGKTRVLTNRILHLVENCNVNPSNILAITFTNKAANEMKQRLLATCPEARYMTISTIHSFCARVLREEAGYISRSRDFTIYVDDDKKNVLKKVVEDVDDELGSDQINVIGNAISQLKNSAIELTEEDSLLDVVGSELPTDGNALQDSISACGSIIKNIGEPALIKIINQYNNSLTSNNAMDFDDLLHYVHKLFSTCPEVLDKYQDRYKHVLIDEFQDTNKVQFEIFTMLSKRNNNIFVVGDDDQSIYGWRGANVNNVLDFNDHFPDSQIFMLEQNYRSTKKILDVANVIIAKNTNRYDKKLWTDNGDGVRVERFCGGDDQEEVSYVCKQITALLRQGYSRSDFAILMRINALTRPFEQQFIALGLPYKIYGGFKFFDRKEIKDVLSYMRLVNNKYDNEAFFRCVNVPYRRGIGATTIAKLSKLSMEMALPIMDIISDSRNLEGVFNKGVIAKLTNFYDLYHQLVELNSQRSVLDFFRGMIELTEFKRYYNEIGDTDRLLNIDQLEQSIVDLCGDRNNITLSMYLESACLGESEIESEDDVDCITLATVHAVKGLEYRVVFVVGLNEEIFPSARAKYSANQQQEERRLMYVAATRARERLYLTSCRSRFLYGQRRYMLASTYYSEVDSYLQPARVVSSRMLDDDRVLDRLNRNDVSSRAKQVIVGAKLDVDISKYHVGNVVEHKSFGKGFILMIVNGNADILFDGFGKKKINLNVAPLKIIK